MPEITDVKELDGLVCQSFAELGHKCSTFPLETRKMKVRCSSVLLEAARTLNPHGVEVGRIEIIGRGEVHIICDYAPVNEAMESVHRTLIDGGYKSSFTYCFD